MIRTEEQQGAIDSRAALVSVSAAAGSGKTRVLVNRVVALLEEQGRGASLDRIVAITFTEKAAAEMKFRLREEFRKRASDGEREEMNRWRGFERQLESAHIETIHAFCTSLLKEHALEMGLEPDFGILDEAEHLLARDEILQSTLHDLLENGNPHAFRLCSEKNLWNTTELLKAIFKQKSVLEKYLATPSYFDESIFLKLCEEIVQTEKERLYRDMGKHLETMEWLEIFKGYDGCCDESQNSYEQLRNKFIIFLQRIINEEPLAEIDSAISEIRMHNLSKGKRTGWHEESTFEEFKHIQKTFCKDTSWLDKTFPKLQADEEVEQLHAEIMVSLMHVCQAISVAYDENLSRIGKLDFDSLIQKTHQKITADPEFCDKVASRFGHFLIDEFQDTDAVQLGIFKALCESESRPSLFVVGDPKQSIYYFRGADVEVFNNLRMQTEFDLKLTKNFRTVESIVSFINHFFQKSRLLSAVEKDYQAMVPERSRVKHPCVEFLMPTPDTAAAKTNAKQSRNDEAALLADKLAYLCGEDGPNIVYDESIQGYRKARYGDCALLFRVASSVHKYENALRAKGIPYVLVSGSGFYERQEVLDILNVLKVALDPYNEMALLAFLRSPLAALHDESIYRMTQAGSLCTVFSGDTIFEGFTQIDELASARKLMQELWNATEYSVAQLMRHILQETQYEAVLVSQYLGIQKVSNVRKLLSIAENLGTSLTLRSFVHFLNEMRSKAVPEAEASIIPEGANAVALMTVHKSKGLEFPVVFIPDISGEKNHNTDGFYMHKDAGLSLRMDTFDDKRPQPLVSQFIKKRIEREEQADFYRGLYVALTRAQDYLVVCGKEGADKASWFHQFEKTFDVQSPQDGDILRRGNGVEILITRTLPPTEKLPVQDKPKDAPSLEALKKNIAPIRSAAPQLQSLSVTAILHHMAQGLDEHEERSEVSHSEAVQPSATFAMARGILAHRMLQFYQFKENTWPDMELLLNEAALPAQTLHKIREGLQSIQKSFSASPLASRIGSGTKLQRELPFEYKIEGTILRGTIDLLLDECVIIDYKTGRYDEQRHARYEWQLLLYAAAVRDLLGVQPELAIVHYLDEDKTIEFIPDSGQIESALRHAKEVIGEMCCLA